MNKKLAIALLAILGYAVINEFVKVKVIAIDMERQKVKLSMKV